MKVLITGANSGIGRDLARVLHGMGHELYLAARSAERLDELKRELDGKPKVFTADLSKGEACFELYEKLKDEGIDALVNNAGFGLFGAFDETDLNRELEMIDVNIRAVHILTKLFLKDFETKDCGYILNVASSAAFLPGPLMATYYATKAYVLRLSTAVREELRRNGRHVYIGALCPGPVETEFNNTAGVSFSLRALTSRSVAEYAVRKMLAKKAIIVPGVTVRLGVFAQRFVPNWLISRIAYNIQRSKG